MSQFVKVAAVSDVADPGKVTLEVADRIVVLIHAAGQFYCIDDVCTHDGGPLGDGHLDDHHVCCPRHGARFDIRTGRAMTLPATEATAVHEVKVVDRDVWVRIRVVS